MSNINLELYDNKYLYTYITTHFNPQKKFYPDSPVYVYDKYINKYRIRCCNDCGLEDTLSVDEFNYLVINYKDKKVVTNKGYIYIKSINDVIWKCINCNEMKSKFIIRSNSKVNEDKKKDLNIINDKELKINKINNYQNDHNDIKNLVNNTINNITCVNLKECIIDICEIFIEINKLFDKIEKIHNEHNIIINTNIDSKKKRMHNKKINMKKKILLLSAKKLKYLMIDKYNNMYSYDTFNNYKNHEIIIYLYKIYDKYINYFKYIQ